MLLTELIPDAAAARSDGVDPDVLFDTFTTWTADRGLTLYPEIAIQLAIALAVFAVLPVLRNTMVGLDQVDKATIEAGRGMGMSKLMALRKIELPLAVPVILAGVRTALIINVGMATLAAIGSIYQSEIAFGLDDFIDSYGMISLGYVAILGYTLVGSLAFGLLGATLWGAYARLSRKRNALYPAGQCFAYQSGLFTLWVLGYYPLLAIVFIVFDRMWNYNAPTPVWVGFLPFIFPAYTLLMMAVGFTLQGRLLAGARHGNG